MKVFAKIMKYVSVGLVRAIFGYIIIKTALTLTDIVTVPAPAGELTNGYVALAFFGYGSLLCLCTFLGGIFKDK